MKITQQLIERIEGLESYGVPENVIQELLLLPESPASLKETFREMQSIHC